MYKLIQSSCALVRNWGTTDRRVTIIYAFVSLFTCTPLLSSYVELPSLLILMTYALVCFRGTTRYRGGRRLSRRADRQTQSCGCVRCNSKPRSGRVTATTERLVDEILVVDDEG